MLLHPKNLLCKSINVIVLMVAENIMHLMVQHLLEHSYCYGLRRPQIVVEIIDWVGKEDATHQSLGAPGTQFFDVSHLFRRHLGAQDFSSYLMP